MNYALFAKETEVSLAVGDINADSEVNIADLVMLRNHLMCIDPLDDEQYAAADVISDGVIDTFDLVKLRQIVFKG